METQHLPEFEPAPAVSKAAGRVIQHQQAKTAASDKLKAAHEDFRLKLAQEGKGRKKVTIGGWEVHAKTGNPSVTCKQVDASKATPKPADDKATPPAAKRKRSKKRTGGTKP